MYRPGYSTMLRILGAEGGVPGVTLVAALRQLSADLQVPTPSRYGIDRDRWEGLLPTMAAQALASGSLIDK